MRCIKMNNANSTTKRALVIAEKKSLLDSILEAHKTNRSKFDYELDGIAQVGHLFGLKSPRELDESMGRWDIEKFPWYPVHYEYTIREKNEDKKYKRSKTQIFSEIKAAIHSGKYDFIIHAGDPDQEGEILIRETLLEAGNTLPVKRIWINASTIDEFTNGLLNLKSDNDVFFENMYQAALARQHSDYLIGMNFSPIMSLKSGDTLHIGRLKTFINGLVVSREKEIQNWKPSSTYEVVSNYKEGFSGAYTGEKFKTREKALEFIKELNSNAIVSSVETQREKQLSPPLFKLSTIQIAAAELGYDANTTQDILQSLYTKKYTTYPRTTCEYINDQANFEKMLESASVFEELKPYIEKITKEDIKRIKGNKKYVNNKKVAESGHCALTPTTVTPNLESLTEQERDIMYLVFAQYVAMYLPPLIQDKTKIITVNNGYEFATNGKVVIDKGYTKLLAKKLEETVIPKIETDAIVNVEDFKAEEKKAKCPQRYTEATLVQALEYPMKYINDERLKKLKSEIDISIGQPSTRGPIIKDLQRLGYIEAKKGKGKTASLFPTKKNIAHIHNLGECDLLKADTTIYWEEKLERIRKGNYTRKEFESNITEFINETVAELKDKKMEAKTEVCKCFNCGGSVIEKAKIYSCTSCKNVLWKDGYFAKMGIKVDDKFAEKIMGSGKIFCKDLKSKNGKKFDATVISEICDEGVKYKFDFPEKVLIGICPKCNGKVYSSPKTYSCENKDCNFAIWKEDNFFGKFNKKINDNIAKNFLSRRESYVERLYSQKTGKYFSAIITVDYSGEYPKYNIRF